MTKSYFKMVPTTCRRDEGEGATHIIREEKSHTWKECLLPLLWFYVTIKEKRKIGFDDLPMSVGEGRYQLC